jgi:hypothetical protein
LEEIPARLPDVTMHVTYGGDTIKMSDTRPAFMAWILQSGFRDLTETMMIFLEEVRHVAVIYKFFPTRSTTVTGAEWNALIEDRSEQRSASFNRLTLPDKLDRLRNEYFVELESDLERMFCGLNACRNCLVHRAGVVGDKDLDSAGSLTLTWRHLVVEIVGVDGSVRELKLGDIAEGGEQVRLRQVDSTKKFNKGDRLAFTAQEFADFCWTMDLVAQAFVKNLEEKQQSIAAETT